LTLILLLKIIYSMKSQSKDYLAESIEVIKSKHTLIKGDRQTLLVQQPLRTGMQQPGGAGLCSSQYRSESSLLRLQQGFRSSQPGSDAQLLLLS
jgi:hypothetical protein